MDMKVRNDIDNQDAAAKAPPLSSKDAAHYTASIAGDLRQMARRHNQKLLAHLLDLAAREARWQATVLRAPVNQQ